jgi:hypothetical protein
MLHNFCTIAIFHNWANSTDNCWCSLASYITDDAIRKGILFPSISRLAPHPALAIALCNHMHCTLSLLTTTHPHCSIRHITARVGAAVARAAVDEDLAEGCSDVDPRELKSMSEVCHTKSHISKVACQNSAWFSLCAHSRTQWTTWLGRCGTLFTAPLWMTNRVQRSTPEEMYQAHIFVLSS